MVEIYFDGSCLPRNPGGCARYGMVVKDGSKTIYEERGKVAEGKEASCNVGEWAGFRAAIRWILKNGNQPAMIFGDSMLVINQANGRWRIKGGLYAGIAREVMKEMKGINNLTKIKWIPRERNSHADFLSR